MLACTLQAAVLFLQIPFFETSGAEAPKALVRCVSTPANLLRILSTARRGTERLFQARFCTTGLRLICRWEKEMVAARID